jgi:hypothetical protein
MVPAMWIRWQSAFPTIKACGLRKLPYADSRRVLKEVSAWLKGNTSATILYIGAHGAHNGLGDGSVVLEAAGAAAQLQSNENSVSPARKRNPGLA